MTQSELKELTNLGAELGAAKAENDRLRALLREVRVLLANSSYKISGTAAFLSSIDNALSQQAEPCDLGEGGISSSWKRAVIEAQADPTDTFTAVDMATAAAQGFRDGQAAVEQDTAQDEREASRSVEHIVRALNASVAVGSDGDWVSIRREHRDAAVRMLSDLDADFRHVYQAYAEAQKRATRPAQTEQQQPDIACGLCGKPTVCGKVLCEACAYAPIAQTAPQGKFRMGDLVKKSTGSEWVGRVVGWYSTGQTPEGYAVESEVHAGSVQIYPAKALEAVE